MSVSVFNAVFGSTFPEADLERSLDTLDVGVLDLVNNDESVEFPVKPVSIFFTLSLMPIFPTQTISNGSRTSSRDAFLATEVMFELS